MKVRKLSHLEEILIGWDFPRFAGYHLFFFAVLIQSFANNRTLLSVFWSTFLESKKNTSRPMNIYYGGNHS